MQVHHTDYHHRHRHLYFDCIDFTSASTASPILLLLAPILATLLSAASTASIKLLLLQYFQHSSFFLLSTFLFPRIFDSTLYFNFVDISCWHGLNGWVTEWMNSFIYSFIYGRLCVGLSLFRPLFLLLWLSRIRKLKVLFIHLFDW